MSIELEACYERIEELEQTLRLVREVVESDDYDEDRDSALGAIDEALDENVVCIFSWRSSFCHRSTGSDRRRANATRIVRSC
jgi:hypothetical protein